MQLVDELGTSDDLLLSLTDSHKVLEVKLSGKKSLKEKLSENLSFQIEGLTTKVADMVWKNQFSK